MRRIGLSVRDGDAELARIIPLVLSGQVPVVSLEIESDVFGFRPPGVAVVIHRECPGFFLVVEARIVGEPSLTYGGRSDLPSACCVFDEYCTPEAMQMHRSFLSRSLGARMRFAERVKLLFLRDLDAFVASGLVSAYPLYVVLPGPAARSLLSSELLLSASDGLRMRKRDAVAAH